MKTITLAGITYTAISPSVYSHKDGDRSVWIGCNGRNWQIAINGVYGNHQFRTRDEAAQFVADAYAGRTLEMELS
jgi:hypothetical protein